MRHVDLLIIGAGYSGCAAAVAAAREGLCVLLVDRANAPGGAATNCLVNPYMSYSTRINGKNRALSAGIFAEFNRRLAELDDNARDGYCFNEEFAKIAWSDMLEESGVELLYHATLVEAACEDGLVQGVTLATKAGLMKLTADYYLDATGDADLVAAAAFPFRLGRPEDGLCQPMTLCFRLANVDTEAFREQHAAINALYKQWQAEGKITNPRENVLTFRILIPGVVHFNTTRVVKLNPTDPFDVTRAEQQARKQVLEMYRFLRENFACCRDARLLMTAANIGVRESRMTDGEYLLTGEELKSCCRFEDSIALGNYDIDIHNPAGSGTSHYYFPAGHYYQIPFRCLIPKGSRNLLVTGRCISADHAAQASIRILPIVTCLGQAAGVAAAVAAHGGCAVGQADFREIRRILSENGAEID